MTITLSNKESRFVFLKAFRWFNSSLRFENPIRLDCVEHSVEPQTPFSDIGLVFLVLQLVGNDDSKLVVWSFQTTIRGNRLS